jgi:hypothetical protein
MMPTQRIALGEWLPDQPGLTGALTVAKNCYPVTAGYGAFPAEANFSAAAAEDLTSLVYAKDENGTTKLFAAGLHKIYSVDSVGALTGVFSFTGTYSQSGTTTLTVTSIAHKLKTGDSYYLNFTSGTATDGQYTVTKLTADTFTITTTSATTSGNVTISRVADGYDTQEGQRFRFTLFGNQIIGTNFTERLQVYSADGSSSFKNLSDSAPIAKFITVVRDFVVCAHLDESGTTRPFRVRWSAINDETDWVENVNTQSDYQDIPDGGHITGIRGGEFGIILMEKSISRMSYAGTPFIFQFDNISRGKGCIAAGSVCQYQGLTFFLSDDGFYVCDGQKVTPIGAEKVDRFFFNDANLDFTTMSAAADPIRKLIMWNYLATDGTRKLIVYNFTTNKWSLMETTADYISDASTASVTLEQLDSINASIDALPVSMDSALYAGGKYFLGGTDGARVITFTGANKSAVLETGDIDAGRSIVMLARPLVDNGSASVSVASRTLLTQSLSYSNAATADADNRISLRSAGKYHRLRMQPTGDNWKTAMGMDVDVVQQGIR